MAKKRSLKRLFLSGILIGSLVMGATAITAQDYTIEHRFHKVKPNETLWGICQNFYDENNLKSEKYFLQFMYEVEQENEWLKETNYKIQPNDIIKIPHKKILRTSGKSTEK